MKIWIISPYGNLPGEGWREYRTTLIANAFTKKGHDVIWWVSNFEHRSKKFRTESWHDVQISNKFQIKIVPSTSYHNHISLARIKYERIFANNFRKKVLENNDKPDLIIMGEPALFTSDIILDVIRKKNVPFIVDIVDLWPELFNIIFPNKVAFLGKLFFAPLYWRRARLLRKANGITASTKDYLKIGTTYNKTTYNDVIYLGIDLQSNKILENQKFKNETLTKILKKENEVWVIYAGTLGDNYDIPTIIKCAKQLNAKNQQIKIFLAGEGSLRSLVEDSIKKFRLENLIYLGNLDVSDLNLFYTKCDFALSSYVKNSTVSMPVKAFDYFAAGLPLINSLNRDLGEFIIKHEVGLQYKAENSDDMIRVIIQLSNDKELIAKMKTNALQLAKSFDSEIIYEQIVTLAEKIVNK